MVDADCELQSKCNMLFAATAISNGSGRAVVNNIGMTTEIGKIQSQIQEAAKEEDDTPLKKKLDEFGEALAKVCLPSNTPEDANMKPEEQCCPCKHDPWWLRPPVCVKCVWRC